jgi:hypothetical protein
MLHVCISRYITDMPCEVYDIKRSSVINACSAALFTERDTFRSYGMETDVCKHPPHTKNN